MEEKFMKKSMKRVLICLLALFLCITSVPLTFAVEDKLTVNDDGTFRILQVADIQQSYSSMHEKTMSLIKMQINKYQPNLIVMTGDNINNDQTNSGNFEKAVQKIVSLFVDKDGNKIPFAVTYGNHDYEHNILDGVRSIEKQDEIYLKYGAIDFDDKTISDTGTGYIDVFEQDGKTVAQRIIIINSGTYGSENYYGKAGYNQTTKYERNKGDNPERYNQIVSAVDKWTDEGYPTIAFQHIPLREMYMGDSDETSILVKDENGIGSSNYLENGKKFKWSVSKTNPTVKYELNESSCCSGGDTSALYKALAKENVHGLFYGHDHVNTVTGKTTITYDGVPYTLTQGYGGGMMVYTNTYDVCTDNPAGSAYILKGNSLTKETETFIDATNNIDNSSYEGTYISDIRLFAADSFEEACNIAISNKYIPLEKCLNGTGDANLNAGTDSQAIVLGFRKTPFASEALTDIRVLIIKKNNYNIDIPDNVPETKEINMFGSTITYTVENPDNPTDANLGTTVGNGEHTSLYLYKTTDKKAGGPVKSLFFANTKSKNPYYNSNLLPYSRITYFGDGSAEFADLLKGTTSPYYAFLHCSYKNSFDPCDSHYDMDEDNKCDICRKIIKPTVEPQKKCSCNCHKSGFMGFIWKIQNFFNMLFKTKKTCKCGVLHY